MELLKWLGDPRMSTERTLCFRYRSLHQWTSRRRTIFRGPRKRRGFFSSSKFAVDSAVMLRNILSTSACIRSHCTLGEIFWWQYTTCLNEQCGVACDGGRRFIFFWIQLAHPPKESKNLYTVFIQISLIPECDFNLR